MTTSQLNQLQRQGKIQNFTVHKRQQTFKDSSTKPRKDVLGKRTSEEKSWLHYNLLYFCNEHSMELFEEYQFNRQRKWRSDYAIPALRILVEYEGLMSAKSRHTTPIGYSGDLEKYNDAAKNGWKVLRYSVFTYKNVLKDLREILK